MAERIKSQSLERLVNDLRAAQGENLSSITLYGSSAAHDNAKHHDLLIVLARIALDDLRASREAIRRWTRDGQPMPVFFSMDELQRAADVFPIEFLQMEQARRILYGSDPFEFVEISNANLRHQIEYELRTKFLRLRRLYYNSPSTDQLAKLMTDSISSFTALFRAILILNNAEAPVVKQDAIHAAARLLTLDASPFDRIIEMSNGQPASYKQSDVETLFGDYLAQLERVIDEVDRMAGK